MKLKVIEWNVNFGADKSTKICSFVDKYIEVEGESPDIIIFTEVALNCSIDELFEKIEVKYDLYVSEPCESQWYNQVIIAVREELKDKLKINKVTIDEKKMNLNDLPDILHIAIETCDGEIFNIIGTRVKIDVFNNGEVDYENRYDQFVKLVEYLKPLEKVLIMGDFNNGIMRASVDEAYSNVKSKYEKRWNYNEKKYEKSLLRFYNFHMMKELLGDSYVMDEVMGEDSSWGLSIYNSELSYGRIKNDQIITKNIQLVKSTYDWKFVRDNEQVYYDMLYNNRYKKGNKISHGYPDHAILKAVVDI